jgi:hypothetical protein
MRSANRTSHPGARGVSRGHGEFRRPRSLGVGACGGRSLRTARTNTTARNRRLAQNLQYYQTLMHYEYLCRLTQKPYL